jgi:hypothetical protein
MLVFKQLFTFFKACCLIRPERKRERERGGGKRERERERESGKRERESVWEEREREREK